MSEMIDRCRINIARALQNSNLPVGTFVDTEIIVRAAIEAMRVPTAAMICTGDESIIDALNDHGGVRRDPTPAQGCWQAMIDEALK